MDRSVNISLGGQEYTVHRARLGTYLLLQEALVDLRSAGKSGDNGSITRSLLAYLQVCIPSVDIGIFHQLSWLEIVTTIAEIEALNAVGVDFAVLRDFGERGSKPVPWEYSKRTRYLWVHLLASAYHWTREAIENLWPPEAIAFMQEIFAEDQYEREFLHSISEVAYQYDQATKKNKFVPLARPAWMTLREKHPTTRLIKELIPMGVVVYPEGEEGPVAGPHGDKVH